MPNPDASEDLDGGCVEGQVDPPGAGPLVMIDGFMPDPASITIHAGDVLTWTNAADRAHRFKSGEPTMIILPQNGGFDTQRIASGASYAHRFCTPRTVVYFCANHPTTMNGFTIIIE